MRVRSDGQNGYRQNSHGGMGQILMMVMMVLVTMENYLRNALETSHRVPHCGYRRRRWCGWELDMDVFVLDFWVIAFCFFHRDSRRCCHLFALT